MRANKAKATGPERALVRALRAIGLKGIRANVRGLPGRPDIVFPAAKLAVFVNGCYWHRCPYCKLSMPKHNRKYWELKFRSNVERDKRNRRQLKSLGWEALTIWECRLRSDLLGEVRRITMDGLSKLPYDRKDKKSIIAYAKRLVKKRLRDFAPIIDSEQTGGKGSLGNLLETHYFGLPNNSDSRADFEEAGLELKTSPLIMRSKGVKKSKERLVLNMIDYNKMAGESWESSQFLRKNADLLLAFYIHEKGAKAKDLLFDLVDEWRFPKGDLLVIKEDWLAIKEKISKGLAHQISEGDTRYLAACTKGADRSSVRDQPFSKEKAKQRALSLKSSYMDGVYRALKGKTADFQRIASDEELATIGLEKAAIKKFAPFVGLDYDHIRRVLGLPSTDAKSKYDQVSRHILIGAGKKKIEEFEKADIIMRTVRLKKNGMPAEDISFPQIDYMSLEDEQWDDSALKEQLEKRFLFVAYQESDEGLILKGVKFWAMPMLDIEGHAQKVWARTQKQVRARDYSGFSKKTDNAVVHVRPHGRDGSDKALAPGKKMVMKTSFWLDKRYIEKILRKYDKGAL
jgi:DNA mismatch endonuclease Vsr